MVVFLTRANCTYHSSAIEIIDITKDILKNAKQMLDNNFNVKKKNNLYKPGGAPILYR